MPRKIPLLPAALLAAAVAGVALYLDHAGAPVALLQRPVATAPDWPAYVTVLAGDGVAGQADGAGPQARFSDPFGLARDALGNLYVADGGESNRIRRLGHDGVVSTLAGGGEGFADGKGTQAAFHTPSALALDSHGNVFVADTGNHAVRRIAPDGSVTTVAGDGVPGYVDGVGKAARFNGPVGITVDKSGMVYVADTYNDRIRRIAPDGTVSTVAGSGVPGLADGAATAAAFDTPSGLALMADGSLLVADTGNDALRRIAPDGTVSTLAVAGADERRPLLRRPVAVAVTADGHVYSTGAGGRVLHLAPDGRLHALRQADPADLRDRDDDGTLRLYAPRGLALGAQGSLIVADATAARVFALSPTGTPGALPPPPPPLTPPAGPMPWPLAPQLGEHEVVGLLGEVRGSYDGEARDHFHGGLDVRGDVGSRVLAIVPGKVSDPYPNWGFGSLGEGLALGMVSYIHMRVGRAPDGTPLDPRFIVMTGERGKPERVRLRRGTRFAVGDALGSINGMAHVHLEYAPGGPQANPLALPFPGVRDEIAPRIERITLVDGAGQPLRERAGKRLRLPRTLGAVEIVAEAWDQMDGNLARRRLGLYRLGYQLLHADGTPAPGFALPVITQVYDRLPRQREAVKLLYAPDSGITVYGNKTTRFAYAVTHTLRDGVAASGSWQVGQLAPGDYLLRIVASDFAGNVATGGRDLPLTVE